MASSRKVGTNEEVATYGTGKTYTSLATWEADTDIDLVTATKSCVLEVYGNSYNDGNCILSGATTNTSYFRIVRPASGNKLSSGAISTKHFAYTTNSVSAIFSIQESNTEVQDITGKRTTNYNSSTVGCFSSSGDFTNNGYVGCVAVDGVNSYSTTRNIHGFILFSSTVTDTYITYAKNCLSINNDGNGFYSFLVSGTNGSVCFYNCTAVGNATNGFYANYYTYGKALGCGASNNTTSDFSATVVTTNCSSSDPTFVDAGSDDYHLDSADTTWKDADTNTDSWHSSCGYDDDIDGDTRSGSWDIGWDEVTGGGATSLLNSLLRKPFRHMLIR